MNSPLSAPISKTVFSYLLHLVLFNSICYAQQIELKGNVSIQNSEYKTGMRQYVKGAAVSANFTKDQITDNEGTFILEFVGEDYGDPTQLKVSKTGLEVVNKKDLEEVIIGRIPSLRIYMCKEGELAFNQAEYYRISLSNIYVERDRRISILEKGGEAAKAEIKRLEEELNLEIYGKNDAIHKLNIEIKRLEEKLPAFAHNLALVNLDDASELYKKAYEFYLEGKIEEAIALIDVDEMQSIGLKTTSSLKDLRAQKKIINKAIALRAEQITKTVKILEFGALELEKESKYIEAAKYYEAIINVLENDSTNYKGQIENLKIQKDYNLKLDSAKLKQ